MADGDPQGRREKPLTGKAKAEKAIRRAREKKLITPIQREKNSSKLGDGR